MIITEFGLDINGRVEPIKGVRTLRELAVFLVNDYLASNFIDADNTAEYIMRLVDGDPLNVSYYEATPMLGYMIWGQYCVLKDKGTTRLSNRQNRQVPFIISKLLKQELTDYATR